MAQDKYVYSHKELAEILVKKEGLREGIWGIYIEFGIGAINGGPSKDEQFPTAMVPVAKIGIQPFPEESSLSVDAAKVNPLKGKAKGSASTSAKLS